MTIPMRHTTVLADEVTALLAPAARGWVVDGTLGLGGHAERLLKTYPHVRVLGIEWDPWAIQEASRRLQPFGDRFELVPGNFADLPRLLKPLNSVIQGVVLDLGLSSWQLDDTSRGFSFLRPGPLDMRMSPVATQTAWDLINDLDEAALADLFFRYGEEPRSRRVAHALKQALHRGLSNDALVVAETIRNAVGYAGRIDPATRCFQALRIMVNRELENLERLLTALPKVLSSGGRAVVISFHSLEDRRVKQAFQAAAKGCVCPPQVPQCVCGRLPWAKAITRKALQPSAEEIEANPRARSARLRAIEKL